MCDQIKTTRDHIPPICFFPEEKDIPKDKDYRKNLITVPACEEHNLKTSKDDEYIWAVIAFHWQNHPEVQEYSVKKIRRALSRNKKFFDLFFGEKNSRKFFSYKRENLVSIGLDVNRFKSAMQKIARGIYYDHFEQKWNGEITIFSRSLMAISPVSNPVYNEMFRIAEIARRLIIFQQKQGENSDIFYYQISQENLLSPPIFRLVFYGGFEVSAFFVPS